MEDLKGINIPIGFPMANCRHYVVDSKLKPLPVGIVGEICVGGAQVGAFYINRPEENAKSFTQNPFASSTDHKYGWFNLFRTGDQGRFLPNGELEFHGRIAGDKQIKLRGLRIDLGEVEQRLFEEAVTEDGQGLVDVNVVARPAKQGSSSLTDDRQLIAFLIPKKKKMDDPQQQNFINMLHSRIGKHLNFYMLPNGYQILEELPVLIGGKVDRQKLLKSDLVLLYPSINSLGALSTEKGQENGDDKILLAVIDLFRDVLTLAKDRKIEPSKSFFQLGGQSILLLRLQAKIKRTMKVTLALTAFFKDPTPAAIAQLISEKLRVGKNYEKITIAAQEIDWTAQTTLPEDPRYMVPRGTSHRSPSDSTEILVTGADTFIGLHFVATLLTSRSDSTIHFLASQQRMTLSQLEKDLRKYRLIDDKWTKEHLAARLSPVAGTLAEPHFGLAEKQFVELGKSLHSIYHLGGEISLLKTYSDLKSLNVRGTLDTIELASHGRQMTDIHYCSTWSVPHLQSWTTSSRSLKSIVTAEETAEHFTPPSTNDHGYFKARWVAEVLLTRAAQRGFRIFIYRASAVTASTRTGVPEQATNFIRYMIIRMIKARCVPDLKSTRTQKDAPEFAVDFIPVDYLTSTMHHLSTAGLAIVPHTKAPAIFHIGNPNPLPLTQLPALMGEILRDDIEGRLVSVEECLAAMGAEKLKEEGDELRLPTMREYFAMGHTMFALGRVGTERVLALSRFGKRESVVACPPVDAGYMRGMMLNDQMEIKN